ncbi:MAG TPA: alpha/beta fold hydrolase [Steroidobacteraceae bacterium]|nr:alpha/beta fold hydrolase [Steroidobacteraceae bacterium]
MPRSGQPQDSDQPQPRLRRAYYDCRYGQLHIHNAIPAGGGFDELPPVICLHDTGETGQVFVPLLAPLGQGRSVYALDLPGAGGSDPAPGVAAADAALHAVSDFLDSMRIRSFDLLARGAAAGTALRLLELREAAARRVVLLGATGPVRGTPKVVVLAAAEGQAARLLELLQP